MLFSKIGKYVIKLQLLSKDSKLLKIGAHNGRFYKEISRQTKTHRVFVSARL